MTDYSMELDENGEWQQMVLLNRCWPVAVIEHSCDCCPAPIRVGQRYLRDFAIFAGKPLTFKRHINCTRQGAAQ